MPAAMLLIDCAIADHVSLAFHQNAVPIITELKIENAGEIDLPTLEIALTSEPAFALPLTIRVDGVSAGACRHLSVSNLRLDQAFLRNLTESIRGEFRIVATCEGETVGNTVAEIEVYPPSHWGGTIAAPELVAAFVRPNDPVIDLILHEASRILTASGRNGAIEGYKVGKRERGWEITNAIWAALSARGITYVLPPASFERTGQKVRTPSDVLERRAGTCLDLTLLVAACLEQAGLNPVVVFTRGHAFVGLWLQAEELPTVAIDDVQVLRKRRDLEDLVFIETTLLTQTPVPRFAVAIATGNRHVDEDADKPLELAIDIRRARTMQIKPLDLGEKTASQPTNPEAADKAPAAALDELPSFASEYNAQPEPEEEETIDRLERWKRRLLDLSLRNKLLNFKDGKKSIPLDCPSPARLEDMLSAGERFSFKPKTSVLGSNDVRDAALFEEQNRDDGRVAFLTQALEGKFIHTTLTEKELDDRLTELFQLTRTAFEEGGANILFLAFGFLKWSPKEGGPLYRAPLLLIPVSLQRTSVRAGFRLALHEEESRFNPTLLQLLRQDFQLRIPEVEKELPTDQSGLDLDRIWRVVRSHVRDLKGWEVTADVVLSTFSFTKFLMWQDLVERMEMLKRSPVVRHLIDTPKESYGDGSGFPDPAALDREHHPKDVFAPLSADSSQLAAVLAAAGGKDFVLFGPPGTGKSQTIANMISQCLALDKTVLFVSQKTAALEVVQRRLNDIGIGDYCLEIHSAKSQKSAVLGQLKKAWHERSSDMAPDWERTTEDLADLRSQLNAVVNALHARHENGMTAYEAFGRVVANRERFADLRLTWRGDGPDLGKLRSLRQLCHEIGTHLAAIGKPDSHPLTEIRRTEWSPAWRNDLESAIVDGLSLLPALEDKASTLAGLAGLPKRNSMAGLRGLQLFGQALAKPESRQAVRLLNVDRAALRLKVDALGVVLKSMAERRAELAVPYRPSVFGQDLPRLLAEWNAASAANFLVRGGKKKQVVRQLEPFSGGALPDDLSRDLVLLIELSELNGKLGALEPDLSVFRPDWKGEAVDTTVLTGLLDTADRLYLIATKLAVVFGAEASSIVDLMAELLSRPDRPFERGGHAHGALEVFDTALVSVLRLRSSISTLTGIDEKTLPSGEGWIVETIAMLERWRPALKQAPDWCHWNDVAQRARQADLASLVEGVAEGRIAPDDFEDAFETAYARWWSDKVVEETKTLRMFLASQHEDAIGRFKALDERIVDLSRKIVRAKLKGDIPTPTGFGRDPEWGTLARELIKKTRHMPLRQLFGTIPHVYTRLTPCVMMSPLSIAQYLPPDATPFDVVIFDEASQIPVWDAIGAIARGKQVIIAGDPEQLPPTSVGERGVDEIEDGTDVEDQESILSECIASNLPYRRLNWHYRSRHESLIAFSNQRYYGGHLVTFPSPVTDDRAVSYVHVPGGIYERGGGRVNREEARVLVADVVRRLRNPTFQRERQSLGIVTFNGEQCRLIERLLDDARRSDPALDIFFNPQEWHEPVFVKNLENVQGDERDIILFSVAVAPTEEGRPVSTVSSLNKDGGYRRLNVAITRARKEMVVFATLRPGQIDLSRTRARGIQDFKHFLEFAERGPRALVEAFAPTGEDPDSPFEVAVMRALEARGWTVHPQIGVSGFRVDLGVVHPDYPGRYLAGVECDGATYHRAATARDRDRLRENILIGLGWRIRRVWSTEWWMDCDRALERLLAQLDDDLIADRADEAARQLATPDEAELARDEPNSSTENPLPEVNEAMDKAEAVVIAFPMPEESKLVDVVPTQDEEPVPATPIVEPEQLYASAVLPVAVGAETNAARSEAKRYSVADFGLADLEPDASRFYDADYRPFVRRMVALVIATEGPVYTDVVIQRVARAHGFARAAGRIREVVQGAIGGQCGRSEELGRELLWPNGAAVGELIPYRFSDGPDVRDHSDIPLVEFASLALSYLDEGADTEEAVRRLANFIGLGRLREATRQRLEAAVDLAKSMMQH